MNATANRIAAILRQTKGATGVRVERTEGLPVLDIRPRRDMLARLGITGRTVQDTIAAVIGGRDAGTTFEGDRRFAATIRLADGALANLQTLGKVPVPLQSVADIGVTNGPNQISRENGKRRVVVQANMRDAAIVFTGVPLVLVGGVPALLLRGMSFSISAAVGFIALSGIAVLNGLIMVTSIQGLMASGMGRARAAHEGAMLRLRPVVMTALVASLGFVPMALATRSGAEVQKPLATIVIDGPIFGNAAHAARAADALCPL